MELLVFSKFLNSLISLKSLWFDPPARRADAVNLLTPQGFQQKFSFHSKEIVAISCSWCKQAVSADFSNCFQRKQELKW